MVGHELHDDRHRQRLGEPEPEPDDDRERPEHEHVARERQRGEAGRGSRGGDGHQPQAADPRDELRDADPRGERRGGPQREQHADHRRADVALLAHHRQVRGEDVGRGENSDAREDRRWDTARAQNRADRRPRLRERGVAAGGPFAFGDESEDRGEPPRSRRRRASPVQWR